jgi:hypothetical protein
VDSSDVRDRDQLAERLLELVIRPLFNLGLQLQAIGGLICDAEAARRLDAAIADLDHLVETVRTGAFSPDHPTHREPPTPSPSASGVGFAEPPRRSADRAWTEQPIPAATAAHDTLPSNADRLAHPCELTFPEPPAAIPSQ